MKYKLPFKIPIGCTLKITQPYGNTSLNDWYISRNIHSPFHNGTDIVVCNTKGLEDRKLTYGTAIITPVAGCILMKETVTDDVIGGRGQGVTFALPDFMEGVDRMRLIVTAWHCSRVNHTPITSNLPQFKELAYVGNSGTVSPEPTTTEPYNGSHVHFMCWFSKWTNGSYVIQNQDNGVNGAIDPMQYFDLEPAWYGEDTSDEYDLPPLEYFLNNRITPMVESLKVQVKEQIKKLLSSKT